MWAVAYILFWIAAFFFGRFQGTTHRLPDSIFYAISIVGALIAALVCTKLRFRK